jgi:hypothetical protein
MAQSKTPNRLRANGADDAQSASQCFRFINPHRLFHGVWLPQWLEERPEVSERAKKLYAYLTYFAGGKGYAWPSFNHLAEKLHISIQLRMPLTWAREHGIDTRIPGFAHRDQDGDGVSTLMEWKHGTRPTDRLFPATGAVPMKGISVNSLAHLRLNRARLHPSRRRVLAAPGFGTAANQRTFPTRLASPAHSHRPRPAPTPGSGRHKSAVLFCPQDGDHIL